MRLIDANSLYDEINKWKESVMYKDWVQCAITHAPTVDPVTHAKWLNRSSIEKESLSFGYTCSNCLNTMYCCAVNEPFELPKYCSDCGAKMDLESKED